MSTLHLAARLKICLQSVLLLTKMEKHMTSMRLRQGMGSYLVRHMYLPWSLLELEPVPIKRPKDFVQFNLLITYDENILGGLI